MFQAVVGCTALFAVSALSAEPVTYFRADRGVAVEDVRPLPENIDSDDAILWRQPLAKGHSTPCVVGDRLFVTTFENDKELYTVALDRTTGKELWRQRAPNDRIESFHPTGSPAVSTPASDGQRVFSFFGSYGLLCYDLAGKLLWSKPLGPFQDEFGAGSSPILVDGKLILNEDHDLNNFLMAIDPATGETVWRTPRDGFTRSYSTPIVCETAGRKFLAVAGALQLVAYAIEDGRQMWTVDGLARIVNTTPTVADGTLFMASWSPGGDTDARIAMEPWAEATRKWDTNKDRKLTREECNDKEVLDRFYRIDLNQDQGLDEAEWDKYARVFDLARNSLLAIKLSGEPTAAPNVAWEFPKNLPYVPSPLVYRGVIYLVKNGGIMTTLDATTGKLLKQGRLASASDYLASPVAGDGKVYFASDRGVLSVVKATEDGKWTVLSSRDFSERIVATPVLHDGRVYIRSEQAVYCLGSRK